MILLGVLGVCVLASVAYVMYTRIGKKDATVLNEPVVVNEPEISMDEYNTTAIVETTPEAIVETPKEVVKPEKTPKPKADVKSDATKAAPKKKKKYPKKK